MPPFMAFVETVFGSQVILMVCVLTALAVIYVLLTRMWTWLGYLNRLKLARQDWSTTHLSELIDRNAVSVGGINHRRHDFFVCGYQALDINISGSRFVFILLVFSLVLLVFFARAGNLLLGFFMLGALGLVMLFVLWQSKRKRQEKLILQMPLFLQAMSNTLQAGYSLSNSLKFVAQEMDHPLKEEIQIMNQSLDLQIPLPEVLEKFAQKINHPEVSFFTESTIIQIKTGGNLIALFKKISFLIEEKLKLNRDIKSFTSQGKMSGILIAGLWPVSLLIFWKMSPSHIEIMFHTPAGNLLLGISILLELIGFALIWRIIQIKI